MREMYSLSLLEVGNKLKWLPLKALGEDVFQNFQLLVLPVLLGVPCCLCLHGDQMVPRSLHHPPSPRV